MPATVAPMINDLLTLEDLDVQGRRVLLRADLDVALTPPTLGAPIRVADDTRIRAALPTIDELRRRGARVVLISHLGAPSQRDPASWMRPVAGRLGDLTGVPVPLAPAVVGSQVRDLTERLEPGQMLMLENVRFEAGETLNDPGLTRALADLADLYVDDAFASAHQAHASINGVAHRLPSAAGRLMQREVNGLSAVVERPARPLVGIFGGAAADEKIGVVRRFLDLADVVCLGGAVAFPFLAAFDHSVGDSLRLGRDVAAARTALLAAPGSAHRLALPTDLLLGRWEANDEAVTRSLDPVDVPAGWPALDIGRQTAAYYAELIAAAGTVFWSGPMGRFELPQFAAGTRRVARAVASTSATSVVGGGATAESLRRFGLRDQVNHLSTGGAAMLAFLEGRELPGVEVLRRDRASRALEATRPASAPGGERPPVAVNGL